MRVVVAILVLATGSACAIRIHDTEHYVGPVLFRYADSPAATVTQVVQLGASGEAGSQWGVTAGVFGRTAVASCCAAPAADAAARMRWSTPLTPWWAPRPGHWTVSLLYLRGERVPSPNFVRRALLGVAALAGAEVNAVSVGLVARTHFTPPPDAASLLRFDADRPLQTRFIVWPAAPGRALPTHQILKEVNS